MNRTVIVFDDNRRLMDLCGPHDRNLALLETAFGVEIGRRGNEVDFRGDFHDRAADVARDLYARLARGRRLAEADVRDAIQRRKAPDQPELFDTEPVAIRTNKRTVEPRTAGQRAYVRALFKHDLTLGVGPAGTGKTYLAVAVGVAMLSERAVDKLILSRPAVEAGERLGFLPGDMKEKIDPYLRPLYDAINDLWAGAKIEKLIDDGRLEVAPLAFMRGRTLTNAYIVLDEAQNTTPMQMRMFLTRLGENSRMVVTGDPSQVDLPRGVGSGLDEALHVLNGVEGVAISRLAESDVVRHPLVGRIVGAYASLDAERRDAYGDGYGYGGSAR